MNRLARAMGPLFLIAACATSGASSPTPDAKPLPAKAIMDGAARKAKAAKKPLLVLFGATW